jgi:hypothetical protein
VQPGAAGGAESASDPPSADAPGAPGTTEPTREHPPSQRLP